MSLTKAQVREILSEAGIESGNMKETVDKIISGHLASIDVLREEADTQKAAAEKYKAEAERLPAVQKELDELKANGDWKEKYDKLKKDFDEHKAGIAAKEAKAAKEAAARAYYEKKGITGKALDVAMRASGAEIEALELDENGKAKDVKALDELVSGDLSGLVGTTTTTGANTATPPANTGSTKTNMTKEQIMAIKDTAQRQAAMAQNLELFGIR